MKEEEAIARLKQHDIRGLEELVRTYQVRALRLAYVITQDTALAEDIVQTAFLRVYEQIHLFDSNRSFSPWFFKIVTNNALKAVARNNRQLSLEQKSEPGEGSLLDFLPDNTSQNLLEQVETRQDLHDLLNQLSPAQRSMILMYYYQDKSEADIAKLSGRTTGTVKRHLHNARHRLRDWLTGPPQSPVEDERVAKLKLNLLEEDNKQ